MSDTTLCDWWYLKQPKHIVTFVKQKFVLLINICFWLLSSICIEKRSVSASNQLTLTSTHTFPTADFKTRSLKIHIRWSDSWYSSSNRTISLRLRAIQLLFHRWVFPIRTCPIVLDVVVLQLFPSCKHFKFVAAVVLCEPRKLTTISRRPEFLTWSPSVCVLESPNYTHVNSYSETFSFLGCNSAYVCTWLPTFRDNI